MRAECIDALNQIGVDAVHELGGAAADLVQNVERPPKAWSRILRRPRIRWRRLPCLPAACTNTKESTQAMITY